MKKVSVIIVILILISAGIYIFNKDVGISQNKGNGYTILGQVMLGPQCAAQQNTEGCEDKPYETTISVKKDVESGIGDASYIGEYETDSDGHFSIDVDTKGIYLLTPQGSTPFPLCNTSRVKVPQDSKVKLTLHCDTGIR